MKKKKKHTIFSLRMVVLFLLVIIISVSATTIVYNITQANDVIFTKEYEIYVNVDNYVGFDVGTERLTFGTVPAGSVGTRKINFTQNTTIPLRVRLVVEGDYIKEWISTEESEFILEPKESKIVHFRMQPGAGAEKRNYTGRLVAYFLKS